MVLKQKVRVPFNFGSALLIRAGTGDEQNLTCKCVFIFVLFQCICKRRLTAYSKVC